jgi:DNA modification methylase
MVETRKLSSLHTHLSNARTHSKKQLSEIAASIQAFGFTNPVLISVDSVILAGHGRVLAAEMAGLSEVPTICLPHLSPEQARAYLLADNKIALNSDWDFELLAVELEQLGELSFDLPTLGFSTAEADKVIADVANTRTVEKTSRVDVIPPAHRDRISQLGDLWSLDRHRLLIGDARDSPNYDLLLQGEEVGLMFTDPPYNVPIDGHVCGSGRIRHAEFAMGVGEMNSSEFVEFLSASLRPAAMRARDGAIAFVCMDWRHMGELLAAGQAVFSDLKNVCVWNKKNAGQGSFYRSKHEMVFVFKVGKAPHVNNFGLGNGGRYRTNVWDYGGITSISRDRLTNLAMHPTVKPTALVEDAIRDCSRRGDIVIDQFAGSGTTLIAAHRSGRTARLMEFDPIYGDTIIRRFELTTGMAATLSDGRTFEQVTEDRLRDSEGASS